MTPIQKKERIRRIEIRFKQIFAKDNIKSHDVSESIQLIEEWKTLNEEL